LKLIKALLMVAALILCTVSAVRADDTTGTDSRIVIGTTPPGSPPCTAFQSLADSGGVISADCTVGGSADTSITFYVPTADLLGGSLSCQSKLSSIDGWSAVAGSEDDAGTEVSTCTLTAPTSVSLATYAKLLLTGDPYLGSPTTAKNDGDCDLDDDVLGVPVGCDITFDTPSGVTPTDDPNDLLFVPYSPFGVSFDGTISPLPEPGSLALLLVGLLPLALLRRRATQQ
jgi:hypothetical protein